MSVSKARLSAAASRISGPLGSCAAAGGLVGWRSVLDADMGTPSTGRCLAAAFDPHFDPNAEPNLSGPRDVVLHPEDPWPDLQLQLVC
jgi:hypothetical protein